MDVVADPDTSVTTTLFSQMTEALSRRPSSAAFVPVYALWIAEFVHAGGIPLVQILLRRPYDYKTFGIPTLHVFIVTFSSFYTIFLFQQYLGNRSVRLLFLFIINLSSALLIYNRGMFLFNLSGCIFLFLIYKRRIIFRQVAI